MVMECYCLCMTDGQKLSPDAETVTYQFDVPKILWDQWKETNPQTATVRESLLGLLKHAIVESESHSYNPTDELDAIELDAILIDPDQWNAWADTVPRSTPLDERIKELLHEDAAATRSGGYDEMEERTARLLASRIGHRTQTARQAIDRDDEDKILEQLDEIEKIASMFDE